MLGSDDAEPDNYEAPVNDFFHSISKESGKSI